jgi:hypothetical protein
VAELFLLPTGIGSVPFEDSSLAVEKVLSYFSEIPFWPQLPKRSFYENMYVQFSEGMPSCRIEPQSERIYFDLSGDWMSDVEEVILRKEERDVDFFQISPSYAEGFYKILEEISPLKPSFFKCHVTGPISFGLTVTDENKRPILYHEVFSEILPEILNLKALWQIRKVKEFLPDAEVVVFFDEPYLSVFGSSYVSLSREKVVNSLKAATKELPALVGVHCCGNTDWSLLFDSELKIISFDAYEYFDRFLLYSSELKDFLERGGILAWGIVPTVTPHPEEVKKESLFTLRKKFESFLDELEKKGLERNVVLERSLITPNCGTGAMEPDLAELVFKLTREISMSLRGS